MYRAFFGFREKPFNLTPDPKFLYLNASYREALAALHYGIKERKGFVTLVGEAGTGKTTLLRRLLSELGPEMRSVLVLNPSVGFDDLLGFILTDLGRPPAPGTPKLELLESLNAELLDTLARGGNVVVLIDEAQDLGIGVLEELRLLSNLETAKEKILQFVLAGQPELDAILERTELRQLRQRIAVFARLRPLARRELDAYVRARIEAAGGSAHDLFSRPALYRLWRFSRGVPRLVNVAGDNALVTAYAAGSKRVGWRAIGEAVSDLRPARFRHASRRYRVGLGVVGVAAAVGLAIGVAMSQFATRGEAPEPPSIGSDPKPHTDTRAGTESLPSDRVDVAPPPPSADAAGGGVAPVVPAPVAPANHDAPSSGQPASDVQVATAPTSTPEAPRGEADQGSEGTADRPAGAASSRRHARIQRAAPRSDTSSSAAVAATGEQPGSGVPHDDSRGADSGTPPTVEADAPALDSLRLVRIERGDTLTHIVRRYYGRESPTLIAAIRRANPTISDPDVVLPGQTVLLPGLQKNGDARDAGVPATAHEHESDNGDDAPDAR